MRSSLFAPYALISAMFGLFACADPSPPSIVLITIDTLRADALGCYGGKARTPNIDALSEQGWLYTDAYAPIPITTPSHASLFTGLNPPNHGVRDNGLFRLDDRADTLAEALKARGYQTSAFVSVMVLTSAFGMNQGFDVFHEEGLSSNHYEKPADKTVNAAIAHFEATPDDRPFFSWVHVFDPHYPYSPPAPYDSEFVHDGYHGEVSYVDFELGRLIEKIRARDPDSIIIVTSDHGEGLGDHGEQTHGIFLYQATVKVPLILSAPHLKSKRITSLARLIDLFPTILGMAGAEIPSNIDGINLIDGDSPAPPPELAYMETYLPYFSYGWSPLKAIVSGNRKTISAPKPELYDLISDPGERDNLYRQQAIVMRQSLETLEREIASMEPRFESGSAISSSTREALAHLGYVSGGASLPDQDSAGPDPKDMVSLLDEMAQVQWHMQRSEWGKAILKILAILEVNSENLLIREALGTCFLKQGNAEDAERELRRVIISRPDRSSAWKELGRAYMALERWARAVDAFKEAILIDPSSGPAHAELATALDKNGEAELAGYHAEQALELGNLSSDLQKDATRIKGSGQ